jgi:hypothetical protein
MCASGLCLLLFVLSYPNLLNDLAYLRFKSHIKHSVCLIQNKVSTTLQVGSSPLQKVNQTAWSGNAYLHSSFQVSRLYEQRNVHYTLSRISNTKLFFHLPHITCGPFGAPPNTQVLRTCDDAPKSWATCWICWASSLVGANTNAIGPSPLSNRGWLFMCTIAGRMYWKKIK